MPDEMPYNLKSSPYSEYYAQQRMVYQPFVYVLEVGKCGIDFGDSFYNASEIIVQNLSIGRGNPDIEGVAAVFLFRHYLELTLKRIIMAGRRLLRSDKNADDHDVKEVAWIHKLADLWDLVVRDAKSKLDPSVWDSYDIPFVAQCIAEFHERDEKGFAFRYPRQGVATSSALSGAVALMSLSSVKAANGKHNATLIITAMNTTFRTGYPPRPAFPIVD